MNVYTEKEQAFFIWNIRGSFGELRAEVESGENTFYAQNDSIEVISTIKRYDNDVFRRNGKVKNISKDKIIINTLASKFTFNGGEYEVYSQANTWQNESVGGWQRLVSAVSASSKSVRSTNDAVPFMVLWSNQSMRGTAFHLNAYAAWEMKISRTHLSGQNTLIEAEFGVFNEGLAIEVLPGEEVELPEIIYYEVLNRTDMDAWKLHRFMNEEYPKRSLPVVYNTWLYKFHRFSYEDIASQIEKAKNIGVEYFVIDAGWFGKTADWGMARGDWEENLHTGFRGRMIEIADEVRKQGMQFGLWFEAESASGHSEAVKKHPAYFLKSGETFFIDFAMDEAREYIFDKICENIDRFDVKYVKFDFNADLKYDKYHSAFMKYFAGYRRFISDLRNKYPDLYIQNCAAGGMRLSIRDAMIFDGFWPTDNQSPYEGIRIFKDSVVRMPSQWIESWISIRSAEKFYYNVIADEMTDKIFSTNDATWTNIVSVDDAFLCNFMKGRALGLSFDLNLLSEKDFTILKTHIENFKKERDFWKNVQCRILTDTESMLVLEFANSDFSEVEIIYFAGKSKQKNICIYPALDENAEYEIDDEELKSALLILKQGITCAVPSPYSSKSIKLKKR